MSTYQKPDASAQWAQLLEEATSKPGILSEAYRAFHSYSIGNQLLAMWQCHARSIPLGPIATYKGWQAKGRQVRRGEKALTLCMPITVRKQTQDETAEPEYWTAFTYKRRWFVLAQTDGPDYSEPEPIPQWDRKRALAGLEIEQTAFEHPDGNCQGYATGRSIAVSPVAALPHKTTFHELAHVVLGHTSEGQLDDSEQTPRSLRETEAEGVAFLLCTLLDLPGQAEARGYIQHWLGEGRGIPERSARRIFGAAQQILEAGRPV